MKNVSETLQWQPVGPGPTCCTSCPSQCRYKLMHDINVLFILNFPI